MSGNKYLNKIIKKYSVKINEFIPATKKISELINQWADGNLNHANFCGSFTKGTAISLSSEIDILLSFNPTIGTVSEAYNLLYNYLINTGYNVYKHDVSIGIIIDNCKFNLIPGRRESGNNHSLYKTKTDSCIKTNLSRHTLHVEDSFRIPEIKLTKIWRDLHHINFPSIYLELVVIKCIKGCEYRQIESNFVKILSFLANKLESTKCIDLANCNNILSDILSPEEKIRLANQAQISYEADGWEYVVW
ncbi:hypothetical protein NIES4071_106420 (plasmid) [Calothrix sp. NIES-4071]|nr:hypothetical protein NIES4071_106420 [Calothrix sp. NIES-4071]BAZ65060.1 hypothetical protein NIES4105_107930 [Calothrix sp. NIES-4105]